MSKQTTPLGTHVTFRPDIDWIQEQLAIEDKATPGNWQASDLCSIDGKDSIVAIHTPIARQVSPTDLDLICSACNNYRAMLLWIAERVGGPRWSR